MEFAGATATRQVEAGTGFDSNEKQREFNEERKRVFRGIYEYLPGLWRLSRCNRVNAKPVSDVHQLLDLNWIWFVICHLNLCLTIDYWTSLDERWWRSDENCLREKTHRTRLIDERTDVCATSNVPTHALRQLRHHTQFVNNILSCSVHLLFSACHTPRMVAPWTLSCF